MPFNHFDHLAGLFNKMGDFIPSAEVLRLLDPSSNTLLLDIGGGTGRVAAAFRSMVKSVVIADPSRKMLEYALEKGLPAVCTPGENLPFSSNSFDRIIMVDALHHVQDQSLTADELWRVLCVGGRIVILEPNIEKFAAKLMTLIEKAFLMNSHILAHGKIAGLFPEENANVTVSKADNNVMVLIKKVR